MRESSQACKDFQKICNMRADRRIFLLKLRLFKLRRRGRAKRDSFTFRTLLLNLGGKRQSNLGNAQQIPKFLRRDFQKLTAFMRILQRLTGFSNCGDALFKFLRSRAGSLKFCGAVRGTRRTDIFFYTFAQYPRTPNKDFLFSNARRASPRMRRRRKQNNAEAHFGAKNKSGGGGRHTDIFFYTFAQYPRTPDKDFLFSNARRAKPRMRRRRKQNNAKAHFGAKNKSGGGGSRRRGQPPQFAAIAIPLSRHANGEKSARLCARRAGIQNYSASRSHRFIQIPKGESKNEPAHRRGPLRFRANLHSASARRMRKRRTKNPNGAACLWPATPRLCSSAGASPPK